MGGRSRAAAQLLSGQGFEEVYNLAGGIMGWQGLRAAGPAEMGMVLFTGEETALQVASLAYGMEEMLAAFYGEMAARPGDEEVLKLFNTLKRAEELHKDRVFELYLAASGEELSRQEFEKTLAPEMMEGGFTSKEFLAQNEEALADAVGALNVAMMLEAQALDLYLRYSLRAEKDEAREILFKIADDEKAHLDALGELLNERA